MTTRYCNGGSLEDLIQKYRQAGQQIPETFIWHVAVELGKALTYLWQGPQSGVIPGWFRIRHRALMAANVFIHYEWTGNGARFPNGTPRNAFSQIVLGNFGRAARRDDPANTLLPSAMMEPYMDLLATANMLNIQNLVPTQNSFEDVYQYGVILRRMIQAHVPGDQDRLPEQVTVQQACWWGVRMGHHPLYSQQLENWLSVNFEYPNMANNRINQRQTIRNVLQFNFVSIL